MKKLQTSKRLSLSKDTLRLLESDHLEGKLKKVAGGHTPTRCLSGAVCC
jgi:hypothetical protein